MREPFIYSSPSIESFDSAYGRPVRLSRWLTQKWWGAASYGTAGGNYTFGQVVTCEAPFEAIQLIVGNPTTTATNYDAFGIAAQATLAGPNGFTIPVDGSGNVQAFVPVTWGGAANAAVPAGTAAQPTYVMSDPIPLESLPRSDGGTLPLLNIRTFISTGSNLLSNVKTAAFNANRVGGRQTHDYLVQGSNAIGTASPTLNAVDAGFNPVIGIRFLSRTKGLTIMAAGDSLTQGQYTTSDFNAWGLKAAEILSTPQLPVSFANEGVGGQTTDVFTARALKAISLYNPDVVLVSPWSPNNLEGSSGAARAGMFGQAQITAAAVESAGGTGVIVSTFPWSGTAGQILSQQTTSNLLRASATGRAPIFDVQSVLLGGVPAAGTQFVMPAAYAAYPTAGSLLNAHVNDAGTLLLGQSLAQLLQTYIASPYVPT